MIVNNMDNKDNINEEIIILNKTLRQYEKSIQILEKDIHKIRIFYYIYDLIPKKFKGHLIKDSIIFNILIGFIFRVEYFFKYIRFFDFKKIIHDIYFNEKITYKPLISVVMSAYNSDEKFFRCAIKSVIKQKYTNWQLCIADDCSSTDVVRKIVKEFDDDRIFFKYKEENTGISETMNVAASMATGEYVAFMDHDDILKKNALLEVIKSIQDRRYDFIYSDEEKIDKNNFFMSSYRKIDYSLDLLLGQNYFNHLSVVKRDIFNQVGGFKKEYDGSQDYDLYLRIVETTDSVFHIRKVLYSWRQLPSSFSNTTNTKTKARDNALKAVKDHLERVGVKAKVIQKQMNHYQYIKRDISSNPNISIIIPFKDKATFLKKCVDSVFEMSTYENIEVICVNNGSIEVETNITIDYLKSRYEKISFLNFSTDEFNYSLINNFAVKHAGGEYIIFLNNDTEVISSDWIERMLEHVLRPEIGICGAKLYFPDTSIQSAGCAIIPNGAPVNLFTHFSKIKSMYTPADLIREVSAVTGACMMISRELFLKVGGFDEVNLKVSYNDIDLCLRVRELGYKVISSLAELYHYESETRGYINSKSDRDQILSELDYLKQRHKQVRLGEDPFSNILMY